MVNGPTTKLPMMLFSTKKQIRLPTKIVTIQKTADARIKLIQEELTQAKNAKTVKSERIKPALNCVLAQPKAAFGKVEGTMELAHGQKILEKERTHRQELQKHVRKVIHVSRMMKLQTSNH